MAVAMNALMGEYKPIIRIDDQDDFEEISSFDFSPYSFDEGKTCLGLHQTGAVNHGIGS
jgi:hypothetical protein